MATILKFRVEAQRQSTKKSGRRKRRSAEVVIFPGVRIEHPMADAGLTCSKRSQTRRDTLKLIGH